MNLVEGIDPSGVRTVSKSLSIYELRDEELAALTDIARELVAQHDSVEDAEAERERAPLAVAVRRRRRRSGSLTSLVATRA